jgi:FecR protein
MDDERDMQETSGDYLWDRSGPPDPQIERMELALSPLGHDRAAIPSFPENAFPAEPLAWWGATILNMTTARFAAAALIALAIASGLWLSLVPRSPITVQSGWQIELTSARLQPDDSNIDSVKKSWLKVGDALETGADSTARISVAEIGRLEVEPRTRIRLLQSATRQKHIALDLGTIRATIWATPGQFVVDTPSAVAVDLGCIYTLHVDGDGSGTLRTTLGWVGFHREGRDSFIPAGAACSTHRDSGPGTPYFEDASATFRSALAQLDRPAKQFSNDRSALQIVLAEARKRDALTLWHLLSRVDVASRDAVYDRLAQLVPPPHDVTRDGVLHLDPAMLDSWWNALELGDISLWRHWERTWSNPANRPN